MKEENIKSLIPSMQNGRFDNIKRNYSVNDVKRLRGSLLPHSTFAEHGANRLWQLLNSKDYVHALGALSGNQAMQMVRAGLEAIYLSGWQVAADSNTASSMFPDQSLYPANSGPELCKRINNALQRADQIETSEGNVTKNWFAPVVADAEAGFGGPLNAFEIMKNFIEAGAAGVHFEDQLSSEKKCGHLGGKVLIPPAQHIRTLLAARLAADVMGVSTIIIARTDAESAKLITSDIDERDKPFIKDNERTPEGFFNIHNGVDSCIARGLSYAPYADLLWWETSTPNLDDAQKFADAIHKEYPGKMLAYNCSPSFNWKANLSEDIIAEFQSKIAKMGYKFQFVTLAGFHQLNYGMFDLAKSYSKEGMAAYSRLQQMEFSAEEKGYSAVRHQREVGTGYFDAVSEVLSGGTSSTSAMKESTEKKQFKRTQAAE